MEKIERRYQETREKLAQWGVDTEKALETLKTTPISIHCWQGDDVTGFDSECALDGGIQVTGSHPGRARNFDELSADLSKVLSLVPGANKVNVHASYRSNLGGRDRNAMEPADFADWADFAVDRKIGLDFNPTFFAHPLSGEGGTLSSADESVRQFWIQHGISSRKVAEYFGKRTGQTCITNVWIPDGQKEMPIDTMGPRVRLKDSLDRIFAEKMDPSLMKDAVECKLFGIGSEAYVVGSHEFYMEYAASRKEKDVLVTLDTGHFHPTEQVSAKLSAMLLFCPELLVHVSRPVRWDSDHVVIQDDETNAIMAELVRLDALKKTHLALDYFDGSINRVQAWTIGARNAKKSLLRALLQPVDLLRQKENSGEWGSRLAILEEWKTISLQDVWDYFCETEGVPSGWSWIQDTEDYEKEICLKR